MRGLAAVMRRFANFGRRVGEELRDSVRKFTRNVQERARREHRFISRTGRTERSIETDVRRNGEDVTGEVVTRDKIAIFLAEGTRPHIIVPRRKKALRWVSGGKFVFAKKVHHPGTKPDPFLAEAFARESQGIVSRFKAAVMRAWGGG